MLSEIFCLHESLKRCGLEPEKNHPWITFSKKSDGFIVGIDESGTIRRIEYQPAKKMAGTWKLMPSNQRSFPVFNLKVPIWCPAEEPKKIRRILDDGETSQYFLRLQTICDQAELYPHDKKRELKKYLQSLAKRFSVFPADLEKIIANTICEQSIFGILVQRVQKISQNTEIFLRQISDTILAQSIDGRLEAKKLVEQLLLGKWDKKQGVFKPVDIPVVLDVSDYENFSYRIFDDAIRRMVNDALFEQNNSNQSDDICALSGCTGLIENEKFPEPKLPIIGQSYLFSMNRDARCHYRYGHISVDSYPVNKELTYELQDSLLFITDQERRGKTWCSVPGSEKKDTNLLICYLENMPVNDIDFGFLGDSNNSEAEFESTTQAVCQALQGNPAISLDDQLRIFVLKSVDKGRRQVLFNTTFTVTNILSGIEIWRHGARNHPPFSLVVPMEKGKNAKPYSPFCPSPTGVMRLFHHQWIRKGMDKHTVHGCRLYDVYELFFASEKQHKLCTDFLRKFLRLSCPLLLGIGEALHANRIKEYGIEQKKNTLSAVGLIAILLYKLGHKKEDYMKEVSFRIGRILSLADTLHREYGQIVRKDIPSQLIGNAMMKIALDKPQRALARLNQRLLVYIAWADKEGEKAKLAKWAVSEMGKIAAQLEESDLDFKPDETDQAKMLLGYLARVEKKNNEEKENDDDQ